MHLEIDYELPSPTFRSAVVEERKPTRKANENLQYRSPLGQMGVGVSDEYLGSTQLLYELVSKFQSVLHTIVIVGDTPDELLIEHHAEQGQVGLTRSPKTYVDLPD